MLVVGMAVFSAKSDLDSLIRKAFISSRPAHVCKITSRINADTKDIAIPVIFHRTSPSVNHHLNRASCHHLNGTT